MTAVTILRVIRNKQSSCTRGFSSPLRPLHQSDVFSLLKSHEVWF